MLALMEVGSVSSLWHGLDSSTALSPPWLISVFAESLWVLLNCCAQKSKVSQGGAGPWLCSLVCFCGQAHGMVPWLRGKCSAYTRSSPCTLNWVWN